MLAARKSLADRDLHDEPEGESAQLDLLTTGVEHRDMDDGDGHDDEAKREDELKASFSRRLNLTFDRIFFSNGMTAHKISHCQTYPTAIMLTHL